MKDMLNMLKQAQAVQSKMKEMQAELEQLEVDGVSGAGLVAVRLSAKGELRSIVIDPSLAKPEEIEILEDLIVAAHADAQTKAAQLMQEKMQSVTGGLLPPGVKLPF
ncbi:nucleoid-associated protein [Agaricicola taiwanensis]|uniref:Nucleoid-associated protein GCM10007276_08300 n=1 Tax=Agaricicola taiwanensis TaxID=591372 RepID=A0A8J2VNB1_9RHOB|nr:YbaB/EbfC family nucleoid-associated protein [Agaricicola taiwanensis]GGE33382.1 nucleoid-associated protein [Agaricicola taiwanensis]